MSARLTGGTGELRIHGHPEKELLEPATFRLELYRLVLQQHVLLLHSRQSRPQSCRVLKEPLDEGSVFLDLLAGVMRRYYWYLIVHLLLLLLVPINPRLHHLYAHLLLQSAPARALSIFPQPTPCHLIANCTSVRAGQSPGCRSHPR